MILKQTCFRIYQGLDIIGKDTVEFLNCVARYINFNYRIFYNYIDSSQAVVTYKIHSISSNETKYFHTLIVKNSFVLDDYRGIPQLPLAETKDAYLEPVQVFCSSLDSSSWYEQYDCKGLFNFSAGGGFPVDNVFFNISIEEGTEYGSFFYVDDDNIKIKRNSFTNLDYYTYTDLKFEANGVEPEDTGKVKIKISTTDPDIPEDYLNLYIIPNPSYPLRVTFNPSKLSPGDTADIVLEQRIDDYPFYDPENVDYQSFPAGQRFNAVITKGAEYGVLLDPSTSDTSDEFEYIPEGFKFIAKDSIDTDTAKISLRVTTTIDEGGILASAKKESQVKEETTEIQQQQQVTTYKLGKNKSTTSKSGDGIYIVAPPSTEEKEIFGIGKAEIEKKNEITILLGETKYFQTRYDSTANKLKIEEVKPGSDGIPKLKWRFSGRCLGK